MPITLSKIKYGTRSIVRFEALEQTLRLRLFSGPADKYFFFSYWECADPYSITISSISLWFVYVYRRRLREYVPNLLTKFNPVRGFIRYFHTSIDVEFPSVPNLQTKFNPVPVDFLVRAQKFDSFSANFS
jgi:hypothetical protein